MVRDGSAHPASPTIFAGTPATVTLFGTGLTTTEPAAMRAQCPISILPRSWRPRRSSRRDGFSDDDPHSLAGATEGDAVKDRHVVFDQRGLADHKAGGVIEEDAAADLRGRH